MVDCIVQTLSARRSSWLLDGETRTPFLVTRTPRVAFDVWYRQRRPWSRRMHRAKKSMRRSVIRCWSAISDSRLSCQDATGAAMSYEAWELSVPDHIRQDPLWGLRVYRAAMYAAHWGGAILPGLRENPVSKTSRSNCDARRHRSRRTWPRDTAAMAGATGTDSTNMPSAPLANRATGTIRLATPSAPTPRTHALHCTHRSRAFSLFSSGATDRTGRRPSAGSVAVTISAPAVTTRQTPQAEFG